MARSLHRLNEQSVRSVKAAGYHADGDGLFRPMVLTTSSSKPWMKVRDADGRAARLLDRLLRLAN